jgi:hypothetical protein
LNVNPYELAVRATHAGVRRANIEASIRAGRIRLRGIQAGGIRTHAGIAQQIIAAVQERASRAHHADEASQSC